LRNGDRAEDITKKAGRSTISAADVLTAIDDIDFPEFLDPVQNYLSGEYR